MRGASSALHTTGTAESRICKINTFTFSTFLLRLGACARERLHLAVRLPHEHIFLRELTARTCGMVIHTISRLTLLNPD